MWHVKVPAPRLLLSEFLCHFGPAPPPRKAFFILSGASDALFHRQFTDAESRLALFHGSWAQGSPISP